MKTAKACAFVAAVFLALLGCDVLGSLTGNGGGGTGSGTGDTTGSGGGTGSGGTSGGGTGGDGGGSNSSSPNVLTAFPFYEEAVWSYGVVARTYLSTGGTPVEVNDSGSILVHAGSLDPGSLTGSLSVAGKRSYCGKEPLFDIPISFSLRETATALQVSRGSGWMDSWRFSSDSPWPGQFILVHDSVDPDSAAVLQLSAIGGVVEAEFDNTTQQYITEEKIRRSSQSFDAAGLLGSSFRQYFRQKNVQFGDNSWEKSLTITRTGYSIPYPDGTLSEGGTGVHAQIVNSWSPQWDGSFNPDPVAVTSPVSLGFVWPMDRSSVEAAFSVTGSDSGAVTGSFAWTDDSHLTWTASPRLPGGETVTVSLGTGARSVKGVAIPQGFTFDFPTVFMRNVHWKELTVATRAVDCSAWVRPSGGSVYILLAGSDSTAGYTGSAAGVSQVEANPVPTGTTYLPLLSWNGTTRTILYSTVDWNQALKIRMFLVSGPPGAPSPVALGGFSEGPTGAVLDGAGRVWYGGLDTDGWLYVMRSDDPAGTRKPVHNKGLGFWLSSTFLGIDPGGTLFYGQNEMDMYMPKPFRLYRLSGGAWGPEIDCGNFIGQYQVSLDRSVTDHLSLAMTVGDDYSDKVLHLVDFDYSGTLLSDTTVKTVHLGMGWPDAFWFGSRAGRPFFALIDDGTYLYFRKADGTWGKDRLEIPGGTFVLKDLAVDSSGNIHIVGRDSITGVVLYLTDSP